jgi:hypothetical protein
MAELGGAFELLGQQVAALLIPNSEAGKHHFTVLSRVAGKPVDNQPGLFNVLRCCEMLLQGGHGDSAGERLDCSRSGSGRSQGAGACEREQLTCGPPTIIIPRRATIQPR